MASYNFYIDAKKCREEAKECLRGAWKMSALMTLLYFFIMSLLIVATSLLSYYVAWWISIPMGLLTMLMGSILHYGYQVYCLNLAQGKDAKISNLFTGFSGKIGAVIKLSIKKFILLLFWFVLLIVPFFIKLTGYSMSKYLIADNRLSKEQSPIKESKHLLKKNYGRFAKFVLSFMGWYLLGCITFYIGFLWIMPMIEVNKALFYENLKTEF